MKVAFVRTHSCPDRIYVHRDDGTTASWTFPSYGNELPHDLIHFVVELAFELKDGLWGRVESGIDLARVNQMANRSGGKLAAKYSGLGGNLDAVLLSEMLTAVAWLGEGSDSGRLDSIKAACAKESFELPALTLKRVLETRQALELLRLRWRSLLPKGAIDLIFDTRDLPGCFKRLSQAANIQPV